MKSFGWCTWDAFYSQVSAQGAPHTHSIWKPKALPLMCSRAYIHGRLICAAL